MARSDLDSSEMRGATLADLRRGKARAVACRKQKFLEGLEVSGKVCDAARAAGVSMRSVARWRTEDADFRAALEALDRELVLAAEDRLGDLLQSADERVALRTAMFVLERRDRGRWGPRELPEVGATAEEIAQAMHDFAAAVDASVPGPPEAEEAG